MTTALERYVRLEALGLWREAPGLPPREVIVSFGKATLVLTDPADAPLGHWALGGVQVLGRQDDGATVYAMTADGAETLAIRDPEMVAAIAEISREQRAWPGAGPPPRRRCRLVGPLLALAALAAAAVAAPEALRRLAVRMMPPEQAEEIGDRLLLALMEEGGAICAAPAGQRVLDRIAATLATPPPRVRVLDLGGRRAAALPGGTVVLDRGAIVDGPDTAAVGRWIAEAIAGEPPVAGLMAAAGPLAELRYIFTGDLGPESIARAAATIRAGATPPIGPLPHTPPLTAADIVALLGICD